MRKYIDIPGQWSGDQAWSVLELLYQLESLVWDAHEDKLIEIVCPDPPWDDGAPEQALPDDDIPW
jgi:hypothetical protein